MTSLPGEPERRSSCKLGSAATVLKNYRPSGVTRCRCGGEKKSYSLKGGRNDLRDSLLPCGQRQNIGGIRSTWQGNKEQTGRTIIFQTILHPKTSLLQQAGVWASNTGWRVCVFLRNELFCRLSSAWEGGGRRGKDRSPLSKPQLGGGKRGPPLAER